jgi:hypothetical protein
MRYVSRHARKTELNNTSLREQRRSALLGRCEARGREVYTAGGQYLGLAETPERAELWGACAELLKLCKRGADGQPPSQAEFAEVVGRILKAG